MKTYRLILPACVEKRFRNLHPQIKMKIKQVFKRIAENPQQGKPLKRELNGLWSFRVSRYRIVYAIHQNAIEVAMIGPRKSIYQETLRLLNKQK